MKTLRQLLVSLAITSLLVWGLLRLTGTELSGVGRAISEVELRWYLWALLVQICIYPLRAARFASLLDNPAWGSAQRKASTVELVPMTLAHTLFAYLLPAKVGEATLLWYLRRGWGVPAARSMAVLLVARMLDLVCVACFLCAACLVVGYGGLCVEPERMKILGWILVPIALFCLWSVWKGALLVRTAARVFAPLLRSLGGLGSKVQSILARLEEALKEVSPRAIFRAAVWSPGIWVGVFLFYAFLARGFGLDDLTLAQATFASGLAVLFGLLPISAFAGFGSQDAGWVLGFVAVGVDRVLATESGLAIHLIYALHILVLGVIGHACARKLAERFADSGEESPSA